MDNAFRQINQYPLDSVVCFVKVQNQSKTIRQRFIRWISRYPTFGQLGPRVQVGMPVNCQRYLTKRWGFRAIDLHPIQGESTLSAFEPSGPSDLSFSRFPWHETTRSINNALSYFGTVNDVFTFLICIIQKRLSLIQKKIQSKLS